MTRTTLKHEESPSIRAQLPSLAGDQTTQIVLIQLPFEAHYYILRFRAFAITAPLGCRLGGKSPYVTVIA